MHTNVKRVLMGRVLHKHAAQTHSWLLSQLFLQTHAHQADVVPVCGPKLSVFDSDHQPTNPHGCVGKGGGGVTVTRSVYF